jgi:hypothetical protein
MATEKAAARKRARPKKGVVPAAFRKNAALVKAGKKPKKGLK